MLKKKLSCILLAGALTLSVFAAGCSDSSTEAKSDSSSNSEYPVTAVTIEKNSYTDGDITTTETYDENGQIIHISKMTGSIDSENATQEDYDITYVMDDDGNIIEKATVSNDGYNYTETFTYDENGNITNDATESSGVVRVDSHSYVYNDSSQIQSEVKTSSIANVDGLYMTESYEYEYDSAGQLIGKKLTSSSGEGSTLEDDISYSYDDNGNLIHENRLYRVSSGYEYNITIDYSYDESGRLSSKTEIWDCQNMDDRKEMVTTYTY